MTIAEYQTLTGITVPTSDIDRVTAQIRRTQANLEAMLGYTLDPTKVEDNQYIEIGQTTSDFTCGGIDIDPDELDDPDPVIGAYRLFDYNKHDEFFIIDPATEIHAVKLVKDGVTFKTLDPDEYRANTINGIIKSIQRCIPKYWCACNSDCSNVQLAIDADWLWGEDADIPDDLLYLWTDMITFNSDKKSNIKSETLATHSYSKFTQEDPGQTTQARSILQKYAGSNGSLFRTLTI